MSRVVLPVDRLSELWPARLRGRRTGALLHAASADSSLRPTLASLGAMDATGEIKLAALFGPQHGFETTTQDNMIEWSGYRHPHLGIPVHSLYGEHREPTDEMLEGLEVLFIDLVDVGARYYTFIWTMLLCMQAAVNLLVVSGWAPAKGIDLPFVSTGGTSLVFCLAAVGLIGNAARTDLGGADASLSNNPGRG